VNVEPLISASTDAADLMRSLSHPYRLLVLCALGHEEKSVGELRRELGGIEQVPMSQQLMRLRSDGLVVSRRDGTAVYYRITRPDVLAIVEAIHAAFCPPRRAGKRGKGAAAPRARVRRSKGEGRNKPG